MTRCIIVLSTGRSGSSAVAGMLHHLGVHMTDREHTAGFNNKNHPGGHWEDLRWHRLGQEVEKAGHPYIPNVAQMNRFKGLALERQDYSVWGIKTPTFSLTLRYLLEGGVFPDDVRVVAVHRTLVSAAMSRQEKDRPHMTPDEALAKQVGWTKHMMMQVEYCYRQRVPIHHISFERLLETPEKHARGLNYKIGIPSVGQEENIIKAAAFINPQYVRHQ